MARSLTTTNMLIRTPSSTKRRRLRRTIRTGTGTELLTSFSRSKKKQKIKGSEYADRLQKRAVQTKKNKKDANVAIATKMVNDKVKQASEKTKQEDQENQEDQDDQKLNNEGEVEQENEDQMKVDL